MSIHCAKSGRATEPFRHEVKRVQIWFDEKKAEAERWPRRAGKGYVVSHQLARRAPSAVLRCAGERPTRGRAEARVKRQGQRHVMSSTARPVIASRFAVLRLQVRRRILSPIMQSRRRPHPLAPFTEPSASTPPVSNSTAVSGSRLGARPKDKRRWLASQVRGPAVSAIIGSHRPARRRSLAFEGAANGCSKPLRDEIWRGADCA